MSPDELKSPGYIKHEVMEKHGIEFKEITDLEEAMDELDVLYMTRIQRERFESLEEYERLKDSYILTPEKLENAKEDLIILHPLPRVNEISVAVDDDPRACYFTQALNGKYIRMALILKLLEDAEKGNTGDNDKTKIRKSYKNEEGYLTNVISCSNPRCITTVEQELDHVFKVVDEKEGIYRCIYCETKKKLNRN